MSFQGKCALITGSSRGIGRGIALKLAEKGAGVAVHYYRNEAAARHTLEKVRAHGSDGFIVQADVCRPDEIRRMFQQVRSEFGGLDIFVSNARTEAPTFYEAPMEISLEKWDTAVDSQAKAFLVAVREAAPLLSDGGRIVAITFAPGGRFGSWQPWVAMGAAKAAMESLVRYFAVALASRPRHHRELHQPRLGRRQRAQQLARSLPDWIARMARTRLDAHAPPRYSRGYRQCRRSHLLARSCVDYRPVD